MRNTSQNTTGHTPQTADEHYQFAYRAFWESSGPAELVRQHLHRAAEQDHAVAQLFLSETYSLCPFPGFTRDFTQAFYWCERAAHHGLPQAMHRLGILYNLGVGVSQDLAQSYQCILKAAQLQYQPAIESMNIYGNQHEQIMEAILPESLTSLPANITQKG